MRLEVIHSEVLFKNKKHNVYTDIHLMTYEYVPIMMTFLIVNVNNIKQLYNYTQVTHRALLTCPGSG